MLFIIVAISLYFSSCAIDQTLHMKSMQNKKNQSSLILNQALADLYAKYPHLKPIAQNQNKQVIKPKKSLLNFKNVYKTVNIATIGYVILNEYKLYRKIYYELGPYMPYEPLFASTLILNGLKTCLLTICPDALLTLGKHSQFLYGSLLIATHALLYKTIVKLIIYCGHGDLLNLPAHMLHDDF